ncbi:MAG: NAD(P)H-hydrate epimerase [Chloroflexi bacterium]|nr:NAD(P)H-hydrate epimerase [Chloroflexota bacterium]
MERSRRTFRTADGHVVPAVTAAEMREVDRVATEEFGLGILQMMENAGRNLAGHAMEMLDDAPGEIVVLAGGGGNGGGGLCCARHLHNHGISVQIVLDRDPANLGEAARRQLGILQATGLRPLPLPKAESWIRRSPLVVDALIGYSLRGKPRGRTAEIISLCNRHAQRVLCLDVPSGIDATTGEAMGLSVRPDRTLTLALPKRGLIHIPGELYLADIGIPPEVYSRLGISLDPPFGKRYWVRLDR